MVVEELWFSVREEIETVELIGCVFTVAVSIGNGGRSLPSDELAVGDWPSSIGSSFMALRKGKDEYDLAVVGSEGSGIPLSRRAWQLCDCMRSVSSLLHIPLLVFTRP